MDVFMIGVLLIALLVYIIALAVIIKELIYFDYQKKWDIMDNYKWHGEDNWISQIIWLLF